MTTNAERTQEAVADAAERIGQVVDAVGTVVVGNRESIELIVMAALARGHVLVEDVPGLGKTVLSRAVARALGLSFARVQFTPDLLPQDLTGTLVYDQRTSEFSFRSGPVFTQFLLADEVNRTPPKTQAALLEAMAEQQVTTDGQSRPLPDPFFVMATSNPIEYEGTYVLPEAQLDRFVARIRLGYLDAGQEASMIGDRLGREVTEQHVTPVLDLEQLNAIRAMRYDVTVHPDLLDYIVAIMNATREHPSVAVGASPRGGLALGALAQAAAVLDGRSYVLADDIKRVAVPGLGHRIVVRPDLWAARITGDSVVSDVLDQVATPQPAVA